MSGRTVGAGIGLGVLAVAAICSAVSGFAKKVIEVDVGMRDRNHKNAETLKRLRSARQSCKRSADTANRSVQELDGLRKAEWGSTLENAVAAIEELDNLDFSELDTTFTDGVLQENGVVIMPRGSAALRAEVQKALKEGLHDLLESEKSAFIPGWAFYTHSKVKAGVAEAEAYAAEARLSIQGLRVSAVLMEGLAEQSDLHWNKILEVSEALDNEMAGFAMLTAAIGYDALDYTDAQLDAARTFVNLTNQFAGLLLKRTTLSADAAPIMQQGKAAGASSGSSAHQTGPASA